MITAIADTHTAIWYLFDDPRLGSAASDFIDATIASGDRIGLSAVSFAETIYLVEKKRVPANTLDAMLAATADPDMIFQEVALDSAIAVAMKRVSRADVPDLPDRIIAATASFHGSAGPELRPPHPVVQHRIHLVAQHPAPRSEDHPSYSPPLTDHGGAKPAMRAYATACPMCSLASSVASDKVV